MAPAPRRRRPRSCGACRAPGRGMLMSSARDVAARRPQPARRAGRPRSGAARLTRRCSGPRCAGPLILGVSGRETSSGLEADRRGVKGSPDHSDRSTGLCSGVVLAVRHDVGRGRVGSRPDRLAPQACANDRLVYLAFADPPLWRQIRAGLCDGSRDLLRAGGLRHVVLELGGRAASQHDQSRMGPLTRRCSGPARGGPLNLGVSRPCHGPSLIRVVLRR